MIHKLKILPEFFPLVEKGKKRFELRKLARVKERNYYLRPVRHFINQENQCTY